MPADDQPCLPAGGQQRGGGAFFYDGGAVNDRALIGSLGCGSVVNMPVFVSGRFMGTVNILHVPGHCSATKVQKLHDLRPAAMLAFCSLALSGLRQGG